MSEPGIVGRPAYRLYQWAWAGLDWLYPPQCGGCGAPGSRWCTSCQGNVIELNEPVCPVCGNELLEAGELTQAGLCRSCRNSPPHYNALRSWAAFQGPVRNALHRLKYKKDVALGEILARALIHLFQKLNLVVDIVTPVPLSAERMAQRGYNQAGLLAMPLALSQGIAYRPQSLYKVRETPSQVGLSMVERQANMQGAFCAPGRGVFGKRVLVVDDVTTSGATLDACGAALLEAGAQTVYGLTLARALQKTPHRPSVLPPDMPFSGLSRN